MYPVLTFRVDESTLGDAQLYPVGPGDVARGGSAAVETLDMAGKLCQWGKFNRD